MGSLALALTAVMAVICATSSNLPSPSIYHGNWSTLSGLLYGMGFSDACVASALDTCASTPQENQSTPSVPPGNQSVLFNLLHDMGYSDTCIASALEACEGVLQEDQLETLIKEARDLLQETRHLQQEETNLHQETKDLQQETKDLQQETKDLQQEGRDLLQEGRNLQQETRDLQQETRAVLQEERALHQETQDLLQETRDLLQAAVHTNKTQRKPSHCQELLDDGDRQTGVRLIYPYHFEPERPLRVYCDQVTSGGGWTVFQRRMNSSVRENFYRGYQDYREGFGNVEEEFWLGLDALHILTSTGEKQQLRIDLADWEGDLASANYGSFRIEGPTQKYRLFVEGYSGTAEDSLNYHSGKQFSTYDSDNDNWGNNCATEYRGAWWYDNCAYSNLNGHPYTYNPIEYNKGIVWSHWKGYYYSLRSTTMMLRPAAIFSCQCKTI